MSPDVGIAVIVAVIALGVFFFARYMHRKQQEAEPETEVVVAVEPRDTDWLAPFRVEWWSVSRLWGRSHREDRQLYDQQRDHPPAIVGPGRGHAL